MKLTQAQIKLQLRWLECTLFNMEEMNYDKDVIAKVRKQIEGLKAQLI